MKREPYHEADTISYAALSRQTRARYDQAIEREYLVYSTRESTRDLCRAYWDWCKRFARPKVVVIKTPQKATVEMDLISVDSKPLGAGTPGYGAFAQELKEVVEKFMGPNYFNRAGFFTQIKRVPLEQAEAMARDFLRIYAEHFDKR